MAQKQGQKEFLDLLEQVVANSCLCKLREHCPDKLNFLHVLFRIDSVILSGMLV
jgi:hypothetical protein